MNFIHLPSNHVEISARPVCLSEYQQNWASGISFASRGKTAAVNISASEAAAFAAQAAARLPKYEEIVEYLSLTRQNDKAIPPTNEIEWLNCSPEWKTQNMNCIVSIDNAAHKLILRGSLPDQRYPFVTFRIVKVR